MLIINFKINPILLRINLIKSIRNKLSLAILLAIIFLAIINKIHSNLNLIIIF